MLGDGLLDSLPLWGIFVANLLPDTFIQPAEREFLPAAVMKPIPKRSASFFLASYSPSKRSRADGDTCILPTLC
jgi:hypothetical protein